MSLFDLLLLLLPVPFVARVVGYLVLFQILLLRILGVINVFEFLVLRLRIALLIRGCVAATVVAEVVIVVHLP